MPPLTAASSTGLTITNPLILYRALLATKQVEADPSQHRLALHLQKLYFRLKDYSPQAEYGSQLRALSQAVEIEKSKDGQPTVAAAGHPLRRNPLFAHLFRQKANASALALMKLAINHEAAMSLDSPRGLLLHGEVGTGKSMLVDLLADSLPNRKKKRWHFNTFMLETMSHLELLRQSNLETGNIETEYSLLVIAKDMVDKSPILFLDEFQLPDRAASKILANLLTSFFQLGGVLIASSNRMPDELAKASGVEYAPPPRTGPVRNLLGLGAGLRNGDAFAGSSEFSNFLDVLKARCEIWDMEGSKDWRRREEGLNNPAKLVEGIREEMIEEFVKSERMDAGNLGFSHEESFGDSERAFSRDESTTIVPEEMQPIASMVPPKKYILSGVDSEETWQSVIKTAFPPGTPSPIPWQPTNLFIYGRVVTVNYQYGGVTLWTFPELCGGAFGPADYITIASNFHTLILTDVPVLTLLQKNEARRLITLLDALYESRCKLVIRAHTGPDTLFFPETSTSSSTSTSPIKTTVQVASKAEASSTVDSDAVYPETLSEIYQDRTSPFRPNISSYTSSSSTQADEDSDFGPLSNTSHRLDFAQTGAFTGEDERFAYKRARSRLWEMCGARWHSRSEPGWWRPLPEEVRRWERPVARTGLFDPLKTPRRHASDIGDVKLGQSVELERLAGLQGKDAEKGNPERPFQEKREAPPKIGGWHAWGMVKWGKKAGAWGRGVDGLEEKREK